jgi:hypothetical protein
MVHENHFLKTLKQNKTTKKKHLSNMIYHGLVLFLGVSSETELSWLKLGCETGESER